MADVGLRAAGMLLFRIMSGEIQYLLMQTSYGNNHWTPPKGHLDSGETDMEAAIRETKEEAGLNPDDYQLVDFVQSISYQVRGKPKTSVYFLAKLKNPTKPIEMSDEHQDYKWAGLEYAKALSGHASFAEILDHCDKFIKDKGHFL